MIAPTAKLDELDVLSLVGDAQRGDREAAEQLCQRFRGWIFGIAVRLKNPAMDVDDLVQEGMIGLMNAVETYDISKGAAFSTRVFLRARGAMIDAIRSNADMIHIPRTAIASGTKRFGREAMSRGRGDDFECGVELTCTDTSDMEQLDDFRSHLGGLNERDRCIMEDYYVHQHPMRQIGEDYGVTESRVSQIVTAAHAIIRKRLELTPQKPGRK